MSLVVEIRIDTLLQIIGVTGFLLYVGSFALMQFGVVDGRGLVYSWLNIAAAGCVLISMSADFNLGGALTSFTWILICLVSVIYKIGNRRGWFIRRKKNPFERLKQ